MSPKGNGSLRLSDHKTTSSGGTRTNSGGGGTRTPEDSAEKQQTSADREVGAATSRNDDRGFSGVGPSTLDRSDPVEEALVEAVTKATIAGQWDVVKAIVDELAARRRERAGVVDLDAVRRERGAR